MKDKEHLLLLFPGFPENEADTTCVTYLQHLVRALSRNYAGKISVVTLHYPFSRGRYEWYGIPVISLGGNNKRGIYKLGMFLGALKAIKRIHHEFPVTRVHAFWLSDAFLVGNYFSRKRKLPFSVTLMGQEATSAHKYARFVSKKTALIALSTPHAASVLKGLNLSVSAIIPLGAEVVEMEQLPKKYDVLGVGSLVPVKGYDCFLEVIAEVVKSRNVRVAIVGEGQEKQRLMGIAQEMNISENIDWLGKIQNDAVIRVMCQSKVFLHTSHFEGFGMVFMEALMAKMNIVSTPVGGALDFQSANWSVGNREELAALVLFQLEREHVPDRQVISADDVAKQYLQLWESKRLH